MKRVGVLASLTCAFVLATGGGTASADFHPACTDNVASADVSLTAPGTTFIGRGTVTCKLADSITIDSLALVDRVTQTVVASASGTCPTSPCTTFALEATAPVATGLYELRMDFTVIGRGQTLHQDRAKRYAYVSGVGLRPTCPMSNPTLPTQVPSTIRNPVNSLLAQATPDCV